MCAKGFPTAAALGGHHSKLCGQLKHRCGKCHARFARKQELHRHRCEEEDWYEVVVADVCDTHTGHELHTMRQLKLSDADTAAVKLAATKTTVTTAAATTLRWRQLTPTTFPQIFVLGLQLLLMVVVVAALRQGVTRVSVVVSRHLARAQVEVATQLGPTQALVEVAPHRGPHVAALHLGLAKAQVLVVHLAHAMVVVLQLPSPMPGQRLRGSERGANRRRVPRKARLSRTLCAACKRRSPARSTCAAKH
jgi:hypothetical protein